VLNYSQRQSGSRGRLPAAVPKIKNVHTKRCAVGFFQQLGEERCRDARPPAIWASSSADGHHDNDAHPTVPTLCSISFQLLGGP
jgi:hypothetical protein